MWSACLQFFILFRVWTIAKLVKKIIPKFWRYFFGPRVFRTIFGHKKDLNRLARRPLDYQKFYFNILLYFICKKMFHINHSFQVFHSRFGKFLGIQGAPNDQLWPPWISKTVFYHISEFHGHENFEKSFFIRFVS